jgi:hypothetical protein
MTARALIRSLPTHTRKLLHRAATAAAMAGDAGQATAEYGLVILAAGGIALGVIAWANGTNSFTGLFQSVIRKLTTSL